MELERLLTETRDDLTLHPELILEPAGDPADPAALGRRDVRRVLYPVPHVPAGEREDEHDGPGAPEEAALEDGQERGPEGVHGHGAKGEREQGEDERERVVRHVQLERGQMRLEERVQRAGVQPSGASDWGLGTGEDDGEGEREERRGEREKG